MRSPDLKNSAVEEVSLNLCAEMMKTWRKRFPAWSIIYVLFSLLIAIPVLSQTEGRAGGQCEDGIYRHEKRDCCRCGVGLKLVKHCDTNLMHGICEPCENGKFSSHPSNEEICESCRSCDHPNENLEVEEPCTPARNTKCRCKPDHYCVSSTEICHLCHPCKKCGAEGIKVQCAGSNNTVCNEEIKDESNAGMIAGIVIGVIGVLAIAAFAVFFLLRRTRQQNRAQLPNGNAHNEEMQHLNIPVVDFQPLIPDIATAVGWNDMKNVAMRSGLPKTKIENCERDHPGDSEEQTIKLLQIWSEEMGRGCPEKLVNILKQSGKQAKAERVTAILRQAANLP